MYIGTYNTHHFNYIKLFVKRIKYTYLKRYKTYKIL